MTRREKGVRHLWLFPLVDRNPQSWVPNIFQATEEDFVPAAHEIHRLAEHPSGIAVGVLRGLGG